MNLANISKKQIIITVVLLLGIVIGVFLVQKQQVIKSKASSEELYQQINVSGADCSKEEGNTYNCETDSDEVEIDLSRILP